MAPLCWELLLNILIVTTVDSLTTTPVPYGVVALRRGEARVQAGSFDVTIVRRHPEKMYNWLRPLEAELRALILRLEPHRPHQVQMYKARLDRLQRNGRRKRGFINAIGSLSKTLFGTATQGDVEKVRNKVNEILADNQEVKTVVKENIVCINEIREQQLRIQGKTNELVEKVMELKNAFDGMIEEKNELGKKFYVEEVSSKIESGLSFLEANHAENLRYQALFQYRRDLAIIGHLTETLVSRNNLQNLLNEIKVDLPLNYLYENVDVTLIKLDRQKLGFYFSIPILDGESYTAWDISSVPFSVGGRPHIIRPELSHVGVGLASGRIIELEYCKYDNPIICPAPLEYDKLTCIQGILSQNVEKIKECDVKEMSEHSLTVKRLSPGSLLLYSSGETIEERCKLKPVKTYTVDQDTYVVSAEASCVLESSRGWKFKMFKHFEQFINVTDEVVFLNINDIGFDKVDEQITEAPVDFNISVLARKVYHELPDTAVLDRRISPVMISGTVISYIALIGVCMIIVFFISVYLRRRWINRKPVRKFEAQVTADVAKETVIIKPSHQLYPVLPSNEDDD